MRCCSRSTDSSSRPTAFGVGATLLVMLAALSALEANEPSSRIERAIAEMVRDRLGNAADIHVEVGQVRLRGDSGSELTAKPAPGARLGRATRFTLYRKARDQRHPPERIGYAVAEAHATVGHVRTTRPLPRGKVLTAEDVVHKQADVGVIPLAALPTLDEVIGATLSRPLAAGALISRAALRLATLVRAGDSVVTRVQVGAVVVAGRTTATRSGHLGDVIGLVNEQSGQRLRGRVIASGEVEVVP